MKIRTIFTLALAALMVPAVAQKKKQPKTVKAAQIVPAQQLKPVDAKVFSYAFGVIQGGSLKDYLIQREGVDSAYLHDAVRGFNADGNSVEAKKAMAYAAGLKIAKMNTDRIIPAINKEAAGKSDANYVDAAEYVRGLSQAVLGEPTTLTVDSAQKLIEQQAAYTQNIYKQANQAWLQANAKKPGVVTTKSGLQYKVLVKGTGAVPADTSNVEVNYEGKLIDGTIFDSSYRRNQPAQFKANQVIKGWTEALTHMPEGSTWELYIPAELAYGPNNQQQIPANSTLIFKVELLKANAVAKPRN